MPDPSEYDFEKLAREIVTARLKDIQDAPTAAAEIADKIIVSGVQSTRVRQDPRLTVTGACRGVMSGMLIIEKDLNATALALINSMAHLAQEIHTDPADMMTWCMAGIAPVVMMGHPDLKSAIREAIEERFMGAGEIFGQLCEKAEKSGAGS